MSIDEEAKWANRVLDTFVPLIRQIEIKVGRKIVVDVKVFDECLERARIGLSKSVIDGPEDPNNFKKAGQYVFWLRKLKPFRVFSVKEIQRQIAQVGGSCDHNFDCIQNALANEDGENLPIHRYVNELISVWTAVAFIAENRGAVRIILTEDFLQDLLVRLRYDAYTPDNLSILFEAMAQLDRKKKR